MDAPKRESRLIDAAREGDGDAWESLYRRLYPRLFSYIARRVGYSHAEDLVNETMARAISSIDSFDPAKASLDGWIFGIARNLLIDRHRKTRIIECHSGENLVTSGSLAVDPEEETLLFEEQQRVRRAFALLSEQEREVLELRVVGDLSSEETARLLGKRVGAIRTRQSRALAHMRRLLEQQ